MTLPRSAARTGLSAAAVGVALAAALAGCGGAAASKSGSTPTTTAPASRSGRSGSGRPGPGAPPAAFGTVAQITGSSMEVQNQQTGQETVSWTTTTRFTKTATLSAASVRAGDCVTAVGATTGGVITARSVVVSPVSATGSCTGRFGRAGRGTGGSFRGAGSGPPPVSRPADRTGTGANPADLGFAAGSVVSVTPTSMVIHGVSVSGAAFGRPSGGSAGTSTPPTTAAPSDITVSLASATTYTETVAATAASLAVGDCVVATGSTDSTGAVAASTVRITGSPGQSCTAGFGGGRFFGGGGGANATPANG